MSASFGISIACYQGDVPLLRGCLESIRKFAPDAPICLVADGRFSSRTFEKVYGVQVIRRADVRDPGLRRWSFGYGLTKMVAFWEGPFETMLHVDADSVWWGDVRKNLPAGDWDVVHGAPHETITPEIQRSQYFDPESLFKLIEPFPWEGNPYFNGGIFWVRRGCLDLDEYLRALELQRKNPYVFDTSEQGILNMMVFRAARAGHLRVTEADLQTVVPVCKPEDLARRFRIENDEPVLEERPTLVHWAGPKPYKTSAPVFSLPMDYFREKSMRRCGLPVSVPIRTAMVADEYRFRHIPRRLLAMKKTAKRLLGRKS